MYGPDSFAASLGLMVLSMLCWGSSPELCRPVGAVAWCGEYRR
jgi:hypothetical protein